MRIEPLFEAEVVARRVADLARQIHLDYSEAPLTVVCIAEGAVRFTDALLARLRAIGHSPKRLDVRARRTDGTALGPVQVDHFDVQSLEARDVLVVDDIADEGTTLRAILEIISLAETRSVRTAVLIDKRERRREPLDLDYVGFEIASGWVIGFGMDVDGEYRELDWIGVLRDDRF